MRPVRLILQAFGPYPEREVIDFRDAVEAGLFGIYGPTGSGKSSIFNAMTFALFGEAAKTEQHSSSLRSDHADPNIPTEVEFVFDVGARRLVILRRPEQMRPKQRGEGETRSQHEAFLFNATGVALDDIKEAQLGKVIAEKKVRDVDAAIVELLGYGPEQFRQIVLLPQGRFEAFLGAKTKERLEILRDLFDVSLYRTLATKLKTDAEAAERHVREEREVCARRLAAEGYESSDALTTGIAKAKADHTDLLKAEKGMRSTFITAQAALATAEKVEMQFQTAEEAQKTLAELQASKKEVDTLADRVNRTEKARSLVEVEANVINAASEIRNADEQQKEAQLLSEESVKKAKSAAAVFQEETDRAAEDEALHQKVEELDRHKKALEKSKAITESIENTHVAELEEKEKFGGAERQLADLKEKRRDKDAALKAARKAEGRRLEIATRISYLKTSLALAKDFEKAQNGVKTAIDEVSKLTLEYEEVRRLEAVAKMEFWEAEQSLSAVQALHLASKLKAGEPCPVCGATDHPAPTTGKVENAGLDKAFREAEAAWIEANTAAGNAEKLLTVAQSILQERQLQLGNLDPPEEGAAVIQVKFCTAQKEEGDLGPQTDIAEEEAEIEQLGAAIDAVKKERDTYRGAHADLVTKTAAEKARIEEMLSAVPAPLRDPVALAAAREKAMQDLSDRQTARDVAAKEATKTREAALVAQKDLQAADNTLSTCRERRRSAVEAFQLRLKQASLSEDDYLSLKPAIVTNEKDRAMVEEHRRKLENAKETALEVAKNIQKQVRPDLPGVETKLRDAEGKLNEAISLRTGAEHQLDHITKLRDELADTLHKLDEAEAVSGPLRNLALLVNGNNSQKLDLETFAIGTMFDQVLQAANQRLGPMTANRYRLERDTEGAGHGRRGLGIQVFDIFTGKARPTTTLSGGETFIAALALALGLADVVESVSGKVRLDTIFIDEGFGSLDTENGSGTLDQVLQVLSSLVSQNRAIGLISHVPLVQEAIPNGFYVRKHLSRSSIEAREIV